MVRKEVKTGDFSNKTVAGVLIVTILISMVSLGVYMNVLSDADPVIGIGHYGQVLLVVSGPPTSPPEQAVSTTGKVGIEVIK
jgi:hypothetical protein